MNWEALESHCDEMRAISQHDDEVERDELLRRLSELRARLSELEAPPVVPEGWLVERDGDNWYLWSSDRTRIVASAHPVLGVQTHGGPVDPTTLLALIQASFRKEAKP